MSTKSIAQHVKVYKISLSRGQNDQELVQATIYRVGEIANYVQWAIFLLRVDLIVHFFYFKAVCLRISLL